MKEAGCLEVKNLRHDQVQKPIMILAICNPRLPFQRSIAENVRRYKTATLIVMEMNTTKVASGPSRTRFAALSGKTE